MSIIQPLSEELINKIAAGEVIERPASVVKELLENSLDAKATKITIEIKDSGKELIRVADNGTGMDEADTQCCFLRHTTSKIKDDNDLFAIQTLGFRGEALASIAAVSQLSIITRKKENMEGLQVVIEGGKVLSRKITSAEAGTTMEIRNLFFNIPARKKFLKTDAVELRHIIDVVTQYALANPAISFRLLHEGHDLLSAPSVTDLRSNIACIYGATVAKDLLEVQHQQAGIQITGFVGTPYHVRNDKTQQALFVNGRWVKNDDINDAIYDAYHSLLFVNKHPVFVMQLTLDPSQIDVNVHPNKTIIKIEQKELVCKAVYQAVHQALTSHNLIPLINVQMDEQTLLSLEEETPPVVENRAARTAYTFEPSSQTVFSVKEESSIDHDFSINGQDSSNSIDSVNTANTVNPIDALQIIDFLETVDPIDFAESNTPIVMLASASELKLRENIPPLRLLGQIHKTFFVAETEGGVFFIDQHAAHERVLYEKYMAQLLNKKNAIQQLLQPEIMEFSAGDLTVLQQHQPTLEQLGFSFEPFGGKSFKINTIPSLLGKVAPKDMLREVIAGLQEDKNRASEFQETIITRMACRSAVMAGEELNNTQMEQILQQLGQTQLPFTCPHGRPTMIKTTAEELEKKFRRK